MSTSLPRLDDGWRGITGVKGITIPRFMKDAGLHVNMLLELVFRFGIISGSNDPCHYSNSPKHRTRKVYKLTGMFQGCEIEMLLKGV